MKRTGTKLVWLIALIIALSGIAPASALQTGAPSDDEEPGELEQLGIVGAGEYISPQFENNVSWGDDWEVDVESSSTDQAQLRDQITLNYEDKATVVVMFIESGGEDSLEYAGRLVRYREVADPAAVVVWAGSNDDGAVILYEIDETGWHIASLLEIRAVDEEGTIQVVELLLYPEYAEEVFESLQDDVEIDGSEPFQLMSDFPEEHLGGGEFDDGFDNELDEDDDDDDDDEDD